MDRSQDCKECSGVKADITALKGSDEKQWDAIDLLRNRLPNWAVAGYAAAGCLIGVLSTLLATG